MIESVNNITESYEQLPDGWVDVYYKDEFVAKCINFTEAKKAMKIQMESLISDVKEQKKKA